MRAKAMHAVDALEQLSVRPKSIGRSHRLCWLSGVLCTAARLCEQIIKRWGGEQYDEEYVHGNQHRPLRKGIEDPLTSFSPNDDENSVSDSAPAEAAASGAADPPDRLIGEVRHVADDRAAQAKRCSRCERLVCFYSGCCSAGLQKQFDLSLSSHGEFDFRSRCERTTSAKAEQVITAVAAWRWVCR
jgi:hypothetical protein